MLRILSGGVVTELRYSLTQQNVDPRQTMIKIVIVKFFIYSKFDFDQVVAKLTIRFHLSLSKILREVGPSHKYSPYNILRIAFFYFDTCVGWR